VPDIGESGLGGYLLCPPLDGAALDLDAAPAVPAGQVVVMRVTAAPAVERLAAGVPDRVYLAVLAQHLEVPVDGGQAHVLTAMLRAACSGAQVTPDDVALAARTSEAAARAIPPTLFVSNRGREIRPKTAGQRAFVAAIEQNTLSFGIGPAGTGKTFLAIVMAVRALKNREVSRLVLSRPAIEAGEKLGFLPGDLKEKVDPYLRPLYDALGELMEDGTVAKYLEIPVDVDAAALAPVAARPSLPSGFEMLSLTAARQHYLNGPRCFAFLRDFDVGSNTNTEYRVFLNCDYLSASTPTTDRHYVGSFGFFGTHGHAHGGGEPKKPSIGVDLTTAIARVYGPSATPPGKLRVQIQPVAVRAGGNADGSAKPASVEVAIVSA